MSTIYDIRRDRLRELVAARNDANGRGGQTKLSQDLRGIFDRKYINHWLTVDKETGKPRKNMEDKSARQIEDLLGLGRGWMDRPPAEHSQPVRLDASTMAEAEGMVRVAEAARASTDVPPMTQDERGYWLAHFYSLLAAGNFTSKALERAMEGVDGKSESSAAGKRPR